MSWALHSKVVWNCSFGSPTLSRSALSPQSSEGSLIPYQCTALTLFPSCNVYVSTSEQMLPRRVWLCCQCSKGGAGKHTSLRNAHQLLCFLKPFEKLQSNMRCSPDTASTCTSRSETCVRQTYLEQSVGSLQPGRTQRSNGAEAAPEMDAGQQRARGQQ